MAKTFSEEQQKEATKYANYILTTYASLSETANAFGVEKYQVHRRMKRILQSTNPALYEKVKKAQQGNVESASKKGNKAGQERKAKSIALCEQYIYEKLVDNEYCKIYTREVEEKFRIGRTQARRILIWIMEKEDCLLKIIEKNEHFGWYVFASKDNKKAKYIGDDTDHKYIKFYEHKAGQITEIGAKIQAYIINKLKESNGEPVPLTYGDIGRHFNFSDTTTKYHILKLFQHKDCKLERERVFTKAYHGANYQYKFKNDVVI